MIMRLPTDTLTCEITPNSVEPTSLSCSMPPLEWLELFAAWGGWVTAAATILLAVFAFAAWKTSQQTLNAMQYQIEDTRRLAEEAQQASVAAAAQDRLTSTFHEAHADLLKLATLIDRNGEDYQSATTLISKSVPAYMSALTSKDERVAELAKRALAAIMHRIAAFREEFVHDIDRGAKSEIFRQATEARRSSITKFLAALSVFQSDEKERDMACHLMKQFIRANEMMEETTDGR